MQDPELTRRLWLLGLGETALGLGFSGSLRARSGERISLPPGLYEPATDHLGHALQSAGRFHPIPAGSPTDYVKPRSEPFKPLFFSPPEFAAVRRITELILGEGDTPQANRHAAVIDEVAEWIDLRVFSSAGAREAALSLDPLHRAVFAAYHGPGALRDL